MSSLHSGGRKFSQLLREALGHAREDGRAWLGAGVGVEFGVRVRVCVRVGVGVRVRVRIRVEATPLASRQHDVGVQLLADARVAPG